MLQMCLNLGEGRKEGTRESRGREMHMSPGLECVRLQMSLEVKVKVCRDS